MGLIMENGPLFPGILRILVRKGQDNLTFYTLPLFGGPPFVLRVVITMTAVRMTNAAIPVRGDSGSEARAHPRKRATTGFT